jgi:hypothetical protein
MLRYMSPYLILAAAVTIAAGVGYGTDTFGVPVTYAPAVRGHADRRRRLRPLGRTPAPARTTGVERLPRPVQPGTAAA